MITRDIVVTFDIDFDKLPEWRFWLGALASKLGATRAVRWAWAPALIMRRVG